jgi:hypothetical protein
MTPELREKIKAALREGTLSVESVNPETGEIRKSPVKEVLRHETPHKKLLKIGLICGREIIVTEDHSIFFPTGGKGIAAAEASSIEMGDTLVIVTNDGRLSTSVVLSIQEMEPEEFTYDLSVPGDENFVCASGIVAHNSYSIGGVSLDIEKSSKYEGLKSNAESQTQEMAEAKARTYKIIGGLQQPRFGKSFRSSFGPYTSRSVLSPRNFL